MRLQPNWGVIISTDEGPAFITDREGNFRVRCRPNAAPSRMFQPIAADIAMGLNQQGISAKIVDLELDICDTAQISESYEFYWDKIVANS